MFNKIYAFLISFFTIFGFNLHDAGATAFGSSLNALNVDGATITYPAITLVCYIASNTKCTFRKPSASAGYVVTSGKTFYVDALRVIERQTSTHTEGTILQETNDVGMDSSTAFTGTTYFAGSSSFLLFSTIAGGANIGARDETYLNGTFTIAAGDYIGVVIGSAANTDYFLWGHEQ